MRHVRGGEAAVCALAVEGVKAIFGIPGAHALPLFDALLDAPQIRRITARHEQGAAFMADGYARTSGQIGVCMTSTGPGALNTLAAMGTAYTDSSPVLNIFSQIPTHAIGRDKGYLHELPDQLGMFAQVTGWRARAESVSAIPPLVHEAFTHMRNGRPRPAALEIPVDVLFAEGAATFAAKASRRRTVPDPASVAEAAQMLSEAKKPLVWAGGGVIHSGASNELLRLADTLQAPVLCTRSGRGAVPDNHPLCLGSLATRKSVREYVASCDVLLAVGSRLDASDTSEWKLALPRALVQVDIDPSEIGRNYPVVLGIVSDAREALRGLNSALSQNPLRRSSRASEVAQLKSRVHDQLLERSQVAVRLLEDIRSALPDDGIVVNDVTVCAYWGSFLFQVLAPRTYLYPAGFVTLGFGLPAAIGAKVAHPDRPVLAICGDGGFLYTASELATAVQHETNIVVLLVNDNQFGILEPQQRERFGRTSMIDLRNPDFVALARAFGAHAVRLDSPTDVKAAIRDALARKQPTLLELQADLPHPFEW
ncbi:MAG: thiamine pyrophosphate-binding protein [Bacillota bacterium]|nr:thiamine pyrophosphate-binding protein [Bacillota bacterium]